MRGFRLLRDDDSEYSTISPRMNNGEFDYRIVRRLEYMEHHFSDYEMRSDGIAKYHGSLCVVSPQEAGAEGIDSALRSFGLEDDPNIRGNEIALCEILVSYGVYACVYQTSGNNRGKVWSRLGKESGLVGMLFGFYMDRPLNRIGSTGWDFIRGDILAGAR